MSWKKRDLKRTWHPEPSRTTRCLYHELEVRGKMARKILAVIGALIGGGLGIAVLGSATQAAYAALSQNWPDCPLFHIFINLGLFDYTARSRWTWTGRCLSRSVQTLNRSLDELDKFIHRHLLLHFVLTWVMSQECVASAQWIYPTSLILLESTAAGVL